VAGCGVSGPAAGPGVSASGHVRGAAGAPGASPAPGTWLAPGAADAYDRDVLALRPVLYLTMGHPSAGTEADLSGHGHTGTYEPAGDRPGTARLPNGDRAADFNGRGQYLQVPSASTLSVTRTGFLTVTAWVRPDALQFPEEEGSGYVYILGKGMPGAQEYALRMYSRRNTERPERPNRVSAYVFNLAGGLGSGSYFQDRVKAGAWMMVTFVIDEHGSAAWRDGYVALYKNGALRKQTSIAQFNVVPREGAAPLRIATRSLESYFEGAIGKVAVFDHALSSRQINTLYDDMS
jgi:Concanavalin A-like lectin/glucanases superfamily